MRFTTLIVCCLATAMLCSVSLAAEKKKAVPKTGVITKLPDNTIVFEVPGEKGGAGHVIIYVNNDTVYTVDGKPATYRDLYKGMTITVSGTKIAKTVDGVTPPRKSW